MDIFIYRVMAKNFWKIVNEVISESDIILEVLDSRLVNETRNKEIEDKVKASNKVLIYVLNKCDLVDIERLKKLKLKPSAYVSSQKRYGITKLLHLILRYAKKDKNIVGVLGYPNTGKSSLVNALKGRSSASTSPISGHTKGKQIIRINKKLYLLDSPGVFPYKEKNEMKHAVTSSLDPAKVKDPELAVIELMKSFPGKIESYYDVPQTKSYEKTIEKIALKNNKLLKGGVPDTETMSRIILRNWQKGKIKL
ncbi:GTPase [Candidatus Woesearchaeota archaeon]|nr:MAG: GTPase [Candidatus Woesearchaeota archaeon]